MTDVLEQFEGHFLRCQSVVVTPTGLAVAKETLSRCSCADIARSPEVRSAEGNQRLREFIGLYAGYALADRGRREKGGNMWSRRSGQLMVCRELLDLLDGHQRTLDQLRERGYVPLDAADLRDVTEGRDSQ